ncbi:MAG: EAL domain-containing protein [Kordiimonadaceae bacterium]|jgi:diguanylate cyclase (GGDEF)-like protein/PAS domain S-box-containing protein|nr:EAL domain-containing protein [Kordiimonadaceae bacterium]
MRQVSTEVFNLEKNKSEHLFDTQSILDSLPCGIALFDENLELIKWNANFLELLEINESALEQSTNISSLLSVQKKIPYVIVANKKTAKLITEMYSECNLESSFNWVYKYILNNERSINLSVDFIPNRGIIITLAKVEVKSDHQLIEFQAAKDYLESQTNDAIAVAEDLAVAKEEAAKAAQQTQTILNAMEEGLVTMNGQGKILSSNNAMSVIFGYTPSEFEGKDIHNLIKSSEIKTSKDAEEFLINQVAEFNVYKTDETGLCKDGSTFPLKMDIREVYLGKNKHYTVLFRNVTERLKSEKLIKKMAWHDSLTGLANRNMFSEKLTDALKVARRSDKQIAVMILDLDKFKPVNDLFGHGVGDKLLKIVAERLLECAREVDTVARLGGDEFAIVFSNIEDENNIIVIADRIIDSIQQPAEINGNIIQIGTSIGISFYNNDADSPEELIRMADVALYQAKDDGRRIYRLYDPLMDAETKAQKEMEVDLNKALENDELFLHFQPQFDAIDNKMVGAEALIRWQHPEKGMISPYTFIPIAEVSGIIIPIGQWVLNTACLAAKSWQDKGLPKIRISVNISARQFQAENFVSTIEEAINISKLDPRWLELEITEGMVIQNTDNVVTKLEELKKLGVYLSIDDFGTGYSSLAYLKRFPVNTLKIDQSFVRNIHEDQDDAAITDAVIRLGHSLGLTIVAEGVETEEHVQILRDKGCDVFQGYYFCRPIDGDAFIEFQKNHNSA